MQTCVNHPERETPYVCSKHQVYLCEECLKCRDPGIYCKFRPACPIWFLERQRRRQETEQSCADTQPSPSPPAPVSPDSAKRETTLTAPPAARE